MISFEWNYTQEVMALLEVVPGRQQLRMVLQPELEEALLLLRLLEHRSVSVKSLEEFHSVS